jgi:predicted Zn-dependent peptidase
MPHRLLFLLILPLYLTAQNLKDFEKKVTEFTLTNGFHFIVCERHDAPVVSFHALVNAGSVDDPGGMSSTAHMFEHMIGKGTTAIGSKNWPQEKKALAAVEEAYDRLDAERFKGLHADLEKVKQLQASLREAIATADSFVDPNAYIRVIEENGGAGFNAATSPDTTTYFYSLPSNRLELWFLLQSEWFRQPVFREFYKERDVVREERRMRVESDPNGKLQELAMATAFMAHPYRNLIGWASDIENLRAKNEELFFRKYYRPSNIYIAIVGDVDADQAKHLAEKYYSSIPDGPPPPPVITVEPEQSGEKRAVLDADAQPLVMIAYHRPSQLDKDDPVFDVISAILSSGRTGLFYKELVRDKKVSIEADTNSTEPGGKYPSLFLMFSAPAPNHTVEENEQAIYAIVENLKNHKVDDETMRRIKTKIRAGLIHQLNSNSGLASQLAFYASQYGNWRTMFTGIDDIDKVTAEDVQRVMKTYFGSSNRTVAYLKGATK